MNPDKYYWSNRASIHHMERLREYLPKEKDPLQILLTGDPRYIEHIEEQVYSADGHRRYDLLIEYDIYHPSHGIYFGCRATTLPGFDHASESMVALKEWNAVLPLALRRLNNVFPEKDFSCRLRDTDNANDRTFWPFWISLHEDESPEEVARVALRIIAAAYRDYSSGKGYGMMMQERTHIVYPEVNTAFSNKTYEKFIERLSKNVSAVSTVDKREYNIRNSILLFECILKGLEERGVLIRSKAYECAWIVSPNVADIEFNALVKTIFELIKKHLGVTGQLKIPWRHIIKLFLRHDESPYKEQIKTMTPQQDTFDQMDRMIATILKTTDYFSKPLR